MFIFILKTVVFILHTCTNIVYPKCRKERQKQCTILDINFVEYTMYKI